jgi:transcription elongation factor SPT5
MDTTKMNPSMAGGAQNVMLTMMSARGPRDRLQGMDVKIVKGQFKGHIGIIKDTNGPSARVEVSSKSKIITMDLDKLMARK